MNRLLKGANATVMSLAVVGIFIVATIFLNSLPGLQWDLSKNKKYTLSKQTIDTLKNLRQDVHVIAFTGAQTADDDIMNRQIVDLLTEYDKRSDKLTFEEIDPIRQPAKANQYQIDQLGTVVFESGGKTKKVYSYELFAPGSTQGSYLFSGEEKFTQTILNLTSDTQRQVYFLTGHGEMSANQTSNFRSSLEGEGFVIKDLNLIREGKVPDDAEAVFILGPQNDLNENEAALLKEYVQNNGKLFIALGYAKETPNWKHIDDLLAGINVKNTKALAIETGRTILGDPLTIVPDYQYHDITKDLYAQDRVTILPLALGLSTHESNADWKANALLRTTDKAYGETDQNQLNAGRPSNDSNDVKGPLDLAYAVQNKDNKPKAIVIGNAQFLDNRLIAQQGNRDFALNSVGWLSEQQNLVTIRPREEEAMQQAFIMPGQANLIFYGTSIGFPLAFLVVGGLVWWRRRQG